MKIGSTFNHENYGPLKITGKRYSRLGNKTLWIGEDENGEAHELDGTEKPAKPEKASPKFLKEAAEMFGMTQGPQGEKGMDADEEKIIQAVFEKVVPLIPVPENGKDGKDADIELIIREMLPLVMEKMPKPERINEASIVSKVLSRIRIPQDGKPGEKGADGSPDTPTEIKEKLESLKGDERLDASAIKNLPKQQMNIGGGGVVALKNLQEVNISNPTNGQALKYNSTTGKWENGTVSGGSVTLAGEDYLSISSQEITANPIDLDNLSATGTPSASTFLRGDNTWATPAGSGDVSKVGTPVDNQVGVWTGDGTLEGDAALTFDTTTNTLSTGGLIDSSLTASEIVLTNGSKQLVSAAVATYPSPTELAYVKGVTSAVQTQLNAKQTSDATLTSIAALGTAADKMAYTTGVDTWAETGITAFGRSILDDADEATFKATVNLEIGTDVQAYDAQLADVAGLAVTDGNFIVGNGTNFVAESGATARTSLGLGTAAVVNTDLADLNESTIEGAIDTLANLTSIQGRTVTLADAGADAILGWDDSANAYENLTQAEVLAVIGDSTATAKGVVELATDAETVTGTDTARATTPANITAKMAAPGTIGGTTPGAATFTTVTVNTGVTLAENASIALDPAGSADGKYSGITIAGTAGEALAFGDVVVLDVTAGRWFKGSVSAAAGADGDLRGGTGICVLAAAGAASATTVLLYGNVRADANFPALTVGSVVYATTSGDITVTQPTTTDHIIKVLGFALTADEIMFCPSMNYSTHI